MMITLCLKRTVFEMRLLFYPFMIMTLALSACRSGAPLSLEVNKYEITGTKEMKCLYIEGELVNSSDNDILLENWDLAPVSTLNFSLIPLSGKDLHVAGLGVNGLIPFSLTVPSHSSVPFKSVTHLIKAEPGTYKVRLKGNDWGFHKDFYIKINEKLNMYQNGLSSDNYIRSALLSKGHMFKLD